MASLEEREDRGGPHPRRTAGAMSESLRPGFEWHTTSFIHTAGPLRRRERSRYLETDPSGPVRREGSPTLFAVRRDSRFGFVLCLVPPLRSNLHPRSFHQTYKRRLEFKKRKIQVLLLDLIEIVMSSSLVRLLAQIRAKAEDSDQKPILVMSKAQPFNAEAQQDALSELQPPYIDLLPVELLERVISLGTNDPDFKRQDLKWILTWRGVSQKWKNVIDNCPSLWSTIAVGLTDRPKQVKIQLEKSKGVLLDLQVLECIPMASRSVQLLLDNTLRWRSLMLDGGLEEFVPLLKSTLPSVTNVDIHNKTIPRDYRLFSLVRPNLRRLSLYRVVIAHDFDPPLGLEDLEITNCAERLENRWISALSTNKFHQFLNANPNLRILELKEVSYTSFEDHGLQPVNLSKLEKLTVVGFQVIDLFLAEHHVEVDLTLRVSEGKPPLRAWTTFVRGLRKVKRVTIAVTDGFLHITGEGGPNKVKICLDVRASYKDLRNSILEDILNDAEKDAHISARVELALLDRSDGDPDVSLEVLKLLQTPVSDSLSGKTRWRLPNLDTITICPYGLSYHHLRAFVQARSNDCCIQPASPVTSISIRTRLRGGGSDYEEVLDEVMACIGGGNDGYRAVC
ncbi:hypothetical protein M407DRAFT_218881 [Tulasnella calospora MUT 4182]|uniref:F-box domain-containing protein n=1 Tax=Tulasnella calospora MUT 4182 TaxID=1051891 RepID=A0A0C3MD31_9AGAM|nr:hypothetical protein M407DRAFT_218881 [Tulasnella calospora MUT 4182]